MLAVCRRSSLNSCAPSIPLLVSVLLCALWTSALSEEISNSYASRSLLQGSQTSRRGWGRVAPGGIAANGWTNGLRQPPGGQFQRRPVPPPPTRPGPGPVSNTLPSATPGPSQNPSVARPTSVNSNPSSTPSLPKPSSPANSPPPSAGSTTPPTSGGSTLGYPLAKSSCVTSGFGARKETPGQSHEGVDFNGQVCVSLA